jgi:hypothetical protein
MFVHASSVSLSTHQVRFARIVQYGAGIVQVLSPHHQSDSSGHGAIDAAADAAEVFVRAKSTRFQPTPASPAQTETPVPSGIELPRTIQILHRNA